MVDRRFTAAMEGKLSLGWPIVVLRSALAGVLIGLGCLMMMLVRSDPALSDVPGRLLSGVVFSIGLFGVVMCKAELFTGDMLIPLGVRGRWKEVVLTWSVVWAGNLVGSVALAAIVSASGIGLGDVACGLAASKCSLSAASMLTRAFLCNALVCLAVYMASLADTTVGRLACVLLPVTCFVSLGLEHSVADMFVFAYAGFCGFWAFPSRVALSLALATVGNMAGGLSFMLLMREGWYDGRSVTGERP